MTFHLPSDDDVARQLVGVRAQVMGQVASSPRALTKRIRSIAVIGIAGLSLSAGTAVIAESAEDQAALAFCYEQADLTSHHNDVFDLYQSDSHINFGRSALDAVSACGTLWAIGVFEPGADPINTDEEYPVPHLTACRFNNGLTAVFPNEERVPAKKLCGTLGLAAWQPVSGV